MPTSISNGESGLSVRTKLNTIWTNLVTSQITVDGDAVFTTGDTIRLNTSDGSDNGVLAVAGGGGNSDARGAKVRFYGNEHSSLGGVLDLAAGNVSGGHIYNYTNAKLRQKIDYNGDISFYEDTGTTSKLQWSASNERLFLSGSDYQFGIGQGSNQPWYSRAVSDGSFRLHLNGTGDIITADSTGIDVTGTVTAGGLDVNSITSGAANIQVGNAAADIALGIGSPSTANKVVVTAGGSVGIGTSSPKRHLHINGGNETTKIQITNQTTGSSSDGDGFQLGIATDGTANIEQRENADLVFATNNTERMRIDSLGNVGIGEIPQTDLNTSYDHLQIGKPANIMGSGSSGGLWLNSGAFFNSAGNWEYLLSSETVSSLTMTNSIPFRFRYAAAGTAGNTFSWSEAARIDASGNLLVGSTDASPSNNSAGSTADNGLALKDNGELQVAAYNDTANSGSVGYFNRTSTDGDIVQFRKDGATVGSIGVAAGPVGYMVFNNTTSNNVAALKGASGAILPSTNAGADKDGTMNLGSSGARFENLYLSGGVVFGDAGGTGTSSSNSLDSYEEGTFTLNTAGDSSGVFQDTPTCLYTKIGNTVNVFITFRIATNFTSPNVGGLPFTTSHSGMNSSYLSGGISITSNNNTVSVTIGNSGTTIRFHDNQNTNDTHLPNTTDEYYRLNFTYKTA